MDPDYDPRTFPPFAVTVDIVVMTVIEKELRVLLIQRGETPFLGRWALPGGFVKFEEDLDDAAARELAEETSITQSPRHLEQFGVYGHPERDIPTDPKAMVSPADGKVVEIVTENDPFHGNPLTRISIFLSVFNVHVNRVPIHGTITKTQYNPGKFLAAFNDKASLDNEQSAILLTNGHVTILVKQIAGLIARRIVCWAKEGDEYQRGQRFGLIRFGSRVDIFVPEGTEISVAVGDIVSGGSSIIGYLKT